MVLHVAKYDIQPGKLEEYQKWTEGAIKRALGVPGLLEFRAYRPVTGSFQIVLTYELADLAAWASWYGSATTQTLMSELYRFALNVNTEVWGPSPVVPVPLRPGK